MPKVQREPARHVTTPTGQVKKGRTGDSDSSLVCGHGYGIHYSAEGLP